MSLQAHPVQMTGLNVPHSLRGEHIHHIGYIPSLSAYDRVVSGIYAVVVRTLALTSLFYRCFFLFQTKVALFNKVLSTMLEPLKRPSEVGERMRAPNGLWYYFFPRVLSYVVDDPELRTILGIFGLK